MRKLARGVYVVVAVSLVTCHVSKVMCHAPHVTCHLSFVTDTSHMSIVNIFCNFGEKGEEEKVAH